MTANSSSEADVLCTYTKRSMNYCGDKRDDWDISSDIQAFVSNRTYKISDKFNIGVENIPIIPPSPLLKVGGKIDRNQTPFGTLILQWR